MRFEKDEAKQQASGCSISNNAIRPYHRSTVDHHDRNSRQTHIEATNNRRPLHPKEKSARATEK